MFVYRKIRKVMAFCSCLECLDVKLCSLYTVY